MPACHLKPGLICVALYNDDIWYRAVIVEDLGPQPKLDGHGVVRAFFLDYGNASRVFYHNIRCALVTEESLKHTLGVFCCQV